MNKQAALQELEQIEARAKALRAIIDEPEKPKTRHGDCGIGRFSDQPYIVTVGVNGEAGAVYSDGAKVPIFDLNEDRRPMFNIFDDLKLYGEDCEKHNAQLSGIDWSIKLDGSNDIWVGPKTNRWCMEVREALAFADKIKQVAFTAKRRASK